MYFFHIFRTPSSNPEHTDELSIIGYSESVELSTLVENGFVYLHKNCLDWSPPAKIVSSSNEEDKPKSEEISNDTDEGINAIIAVALQRKCSFCLRLGASISCKVKLIDLYFNAFNGYVL